MEGVIAFESGFIEHLGTAFIRLALVVFLCRIFSRKKESESIKKFFKHPSDFKIKS